MGGRWLFRCGIAQNSAKRKDTAPKDFQLNTRQPVRVEPGSQSFHCRKLSSFLKKFSHFNQHQLLYTSFYKQGNKCLDSGFCSQEILILDKFSLISVHWVLPSIWPGGSSELFSILLSEPCGSLCCLYGKFCLLELSFELVRHLPDDREC